MSRRPIKPEDIGSAPISPDLDGDGELDAFESLVDEIGRLSDELSEVEAENVRLRSASDIEAVKARMLEPYVNKVFTFVAIYCGFVGIVLFMVGMKISFDLPESILAIISGSTAVSVIGLIGLVITGLFGTKKA